MKIFLKWTGGSLTVLASFENNYFNFFSALPDSLIQNIFAIFTRPVERGLESWPYQKKHSHNIGIMVGTTVVCYLKKKNSNIRQIFKLCLLQKS